MRPAVRIAGNVADGQGSSPAPSHAWVRIDEEPPDVAFVAMHGVGGEDGTAQANLLLQHVGGDVEGERIPAAAFHPWLAHVLTARHAGPAMPSGEGIHRISSSTIAISFEAFDAPCGTICPNSVR